MWNISAERKIKLNGQMCSFFSGKKVEMGGRRRFPAFLFHSHWARESESRIPSQAGTKLASGAPSFL